MAGPVWGLDFRVCVCVGVFCFWILFCFAQGLQSRPSQVHCVKTERLETERSLAMLSCLGHNACYSN